MTDPSVPPPSADDRATDPGPEARRRRNLVVVGVAVGVVLLVVGVVLAVGSRDSGDDVTSGSTSTSAGQGATTSTAVVTTTEAPSTTVGSTTSTTSSPTTTTTPPTTTSPLPGGSTDPRSGGSSGPLPALLTDLRLGCQGSVSRVVFEFADGAMPEWSVQYVDPPILEDASGQPVAVAGDAFLQVRLTPAWGHDLDQPDAPATYTGPSRVSGGCGSALEVVRTGEFEAVYTWVVGVPSRAPFTAATLAGPSRLVIDLAA